MGYGARHHRNQSANNHQQPFDMMRNVGGWNHAAIFQKEVCVVADAAQQLLVDVFLVNSCTEITQVVSHRWSSAIKCLFTGEIALTLQHSQWNVWGRVRTPQIDFVVNRIPVYRTPVRTVSKWKKKKRQNFKNRLISSWWLMSARMKRIIQRWFSCGSLYCLSNSRPTIEKKRVVIKRILKRRTEYLFSVFHSNPRSFLNIEGNQTAN